MLVQALISMTFSPLISPSSGLQSAGPTSLNFEKFLVNQDGEPVKRYSPKFENANIADDIDALLKDPNASI